MPLAAGGETRALNGLLASPVFVSLHTADPGNAGASEISATGTGYARQSAVFTNTGNNPTTAANNAVVNFPEAVTNWGTATWFGLWTAATGGTFLGYASLAASKTITAGDAARWNAGNLTVTAD